MTEFYEPQFNNSKLAHAIRHLVTPLLNSDNAIRKSEFFRSAMGGVSFLAIDDILDDLEANGTHSQYFLKDGSAEEAAQVWVDQNRDAILKAWKKQEFINDTVDKLVEVQKQEAERGGASDAFFAKPADMVDYINEGTAEQVKADDNLTPDEVADGYVVNTDSVKIENGRFKVVNPDTVLVSQPYVDGIFIDDLANVDLGQAFDYPETRRAARAIVDEWKEAMD